VAAPSTSAYCTLKEAFASSSALHSAKIRADANELVKAIIADFETSEGRSDIQKALHARFANAESRDCVNRSLANLQEVSAILDAKAPNDAAAFKSWLRDISQKVAEAADEGGFMGIGGVAVSEAEKATVADIAKALGT
jgi:hypothetical protein